MYCEYKFHIGLKDIGLSNKAKNKTILGFLEDAGGMQSDILGYGVNDIERTNLSWIILGWKVKIIKRPKYGEGVKVKTQSRGIKKIYAFRDYEIYNEKEELIAKATSKWVLYDINKKSIITIGKEIIEKYETEDKKVFEKEPKYKIEEPEKYMNKGEYKINRSIIDVNQHVHNINYIDIAYEALPEKIYNSEELNNIEIVYKKEIKYGDNVKSLYSKKDNEHIIIIKDEEEKIIHAVIKLS